MWAKRALTWLAPSAVAAALGALGAGLVEGALSARGAVQLAATAGFAALLGIPVFFAGAVIARGLWAAWRPRLLAKELVDDRGAAPRLAAWAIYLGVAALFMSWATFHGLYWLSIVSSFKPVVLSLAMPMIVVVAAGATVALSKPLVDLIAAGFARWERRRARKQQRAVTTPRMILAAAIALTALTASISWLFSIRPRIGHFDLLIFVYPIAGIAFTAAAHAAWHRVPAARRAASIAAGAAALILLAAVAVARETSPTLVLDVWSRPTVAGLAVDELFDLDGIRGEMETSAFRPREKPGAPHPDVVLVTIDTVRDDRTPLGLGPAKMPVLAALGNRGAVFEWAFSPGNVTRRSIPSIVLGLSPTRVHGRVAGWALRLDPRHVVLAERFRAAGYDTAAFVCCDSFWSPEHKLGINRGIDHLLIDRARRAARRRGARVDRGARQARPARTSRCSCGCTSSRSTTGTATTPTPRSTRPSASQYDAVLGQVDRLPRRHARRLREPAAEPRSRSSSSPPITARASAITARPITPPISTTRRRTCRSCSSARCIRPRRVAEPVQLVDLAPTLLDLAGFVPPGMPDMDGTPITDLVTGARSANPDGGYAFMAQIADRSVAQGERAVVAGRWKLIDMGNHFELYDIRLDPNEMHDVAEENPKQLAVMKTMLDARGPTDDTSPFP